MPAWSVSPDSTRTGPRFVASRSKTRVAPATDEQPATPEAVEALAVDEDAPAPPLVPARKRVGRPAAAKATRDLSVASSVAQVPGRARAIARSVQANYQVEPLLEPMPERGTFVRPFRKMSDILPYDSYEPDAETAAKDQCFNLCPRPKGGDCPDCQEPDPEGRPQEGRVCPDCPWEQDLRRVGRAAGEPDNPVVPRNFAHVHYCWEPTNLYHNPIYFEDVPLERYGHTRHYLIQPFFSGAKFAAQFVGLPYQMTIYPLCSRQYSLGYYRPGECAPYKYYQVPWNTEAALVEAGVVTGSYFLFAPGVGP
jgi:hypothetical protein